MNTVVCMALPVSPSFQQPKKTTPPITRQTNQPRDHLQCTRRSADEEAALRHSLVFTEDPTDRESTPTRGGVYNATTVPLVSRTNNNYQTPRNYSPVQSSEDASSLATNNTDGGSELARGDPNELGIPNTSIHRWLPKAQRSLLQKQAELFVKPASSAALKAMQPINGGGSGGVGGGGGAAEATHQTAPMAVNGSKDVGEPANFGDHAAFTRKMQETDIF